MRSVLAVPEEARKILQDIKADTTAALEAALEKRHVLSHFQTMDDLTRFNRLTVRDFPGEIDADYLLDGEVVMMRRLIDGEMRYYG